MSAEADELIMTIALCRQLSGEIVVAINNFKFPNNDTIFVREELMQFLQDIFVTNTAALKTVIQWQKEVEHRLNLGTTRGYAERHLAL